jgi:outer membrane protein assembly factor BamA
MTTRTLASWLLAACMLAVDDPAAAQDQEQTTAAIAATAREQRAAALESPRPGRLERVLDFLENSPTIDRLLTPQDGFGIRIGGIEGGPGFAFGPRWQRSNLFGPHLRLHASGAASIGLDYGVKAGVEVPEVGTSRLGLAAEAFADHLGRERFYGRGMGSALADESRFALDRRGGRVTATLEAADWLEVSGGAALLQLYAGPGGAGRASPIDLWPASAVPGFDDRSTFMLTSIAGTADLRDVPGNPRAGGRYHIAFDRYGDRTGGRHSFDQVHVDLEQHVSGWRNQRTLTLRAVGTFSQAADGQEVPFHLQPALGGSRLLRGFPTERFRDHHRVVLQAEYGWDIWPFLGAVLFYETGMVAERLDDIALNGFRRDYGLGFRLGSARTVALRTDVAFGSGEGTRISMRWNHAF